MKLYLVDYPLDDGDYDPGNIYRSLARMVEDEHLDTIDVFYEPDGGEYFAERGKPLRKRR